MAFSATCIWEVRGATGSDNNGGGFVPGGGGTDFSQQASAQVNIDNSAITTSITGSTVTFTAGYTPTAADVGNIVQFLSGTNVLTATTSQSGFYEIKSQTSNTWVLDRSPLSSGTTTNATAKMGGALATPGAAMNGAVASNTVYVKNEGSQQSPTIYTLATLTNSATPPNNVAGSRIHVVVGGAAGNIPFHIIGYSTNRTLQNSDAPPELIPGASFSGVTAQMMFMDSNFVRARNFKFRNPNSQAGGAESTMLHMNGVYNLAELMDIDGNSVTHWYGVFMGGTECHCYDVSVQHIHDHQGFANITIPNSLHYCYSANNNGGGYSGPGNYIRCFAVNNPGAASHGFTATSAAGMSCTNCVSYGNGGSGFLAYFDTKLDNCVAWGNGGQGFAEISASAAPIMTMYNCAGGSNTSGNISAGLPSYGQYNFKSLTADPFTNAAGGDFSLNSTAGGGAVLKGAGYPSSIYTISTTGFHIDIGVWQGLILIVALVLTGGVSRADEYLFAQMNQGYTVSSYGGGLGPLPPPPPLPASASQVAPPQEPEPGMAVLAHALPVSTPPPPVSPAPSMVVYAAQVSPPQEPEPGMAVVAHSPPFVQPPGPTQNPLPSPVVAQQEIPPFFKEDGMRAVLSVTSQATGQLLPLFDLIAFLLGPNNGYYVFLPTDLACPIDGFGQLIIYTRFINGAPDTTINWQCCLNRGHYGVLTWDSNNVSPQQLKGALNVGVPNVPDAAYAAAVGTDLPTDPSFIGGGSSVGLTSTDGTPLNDVDDTQASGSPNIPSVKRITGGW